MSDISHQAGCHCGAVQFEFDAPAQVDVTECNCSICHMTAYQHVFIPKADLRFLFGADTLTRYTFNTGEAEHLFCPICGIKPLYRPRSHPDKWSVNLRCVKGGTLSVGARIAFDGSDWEGNIAALKAKT